MIIEDNFSYFSMKPYVVTPHLNCLDEGSQHMFYAELTKIIHYYQQIHVLPLNLSFGLCFM